MPKIENAAQLAALMQLQISSRLASSGSSKTPLGSRSTAKTRRTDGSSQVTTDTQVPVDLQLAIRELQSTGIALHMAAFRMFLRHNLAKEFGMAPLAEPSLEMLLDEVLNLMKSDHDLKDSIIDAGQRLVELSQKPQE